MYWQAIPRRLQRNNFAATPKMMHSLARSELAKLYTSDLCQITDRSLADGQESSNCRLAHGTRSV